MTLANIDLRPLVTNVVHFQGNRPLCVAFAASLIHEAERTRVDGDTASLAPEALWAHAFNRGLTTTSGTTTSAIAQALQSEGQPPLVDWPFDVSLKDQTEAAPSGVGSPPWHRGQTRHFQLARDNVESELEGVLSAGQMALIVIEVTNEFYFPPASGIVDVVAGSALLGRHAVTCVGAATVGGQRLFLVQNSWGARWASGGYGWLTHRYLSMYGSDALQMTGLL